MNDETIVGKPPPPEPQRIGSFVVIGKLGEGGMGAVYKAHDPSLDRTVALKLLPPHLAADEAFVARFKREATAAAKFSQSNLVHVYAVGEDAGTHYIAMEFVEGESLQKRIQRTGQLACDEALAIAISAAEGLRYAWTKAQLVHRDIKPDNILLSNDGDVKVADLGLAKLRESGSTNFTQTGTVMGSPHYISPEQGRGDKDVDFRSDIYSLGCTLYHMLAGRPPYEGDNLASLIHKHVYESPPDLAAARPDCPATVASLVKRMMAKDRAKRPANYDELIAELTAARNALGKSVTARAAAKSRKMMMLTGAGVVAVVAAVAVIVGGPRFRVAESPTDAQKRVPPAVAAPVPGRASATPPSTQPSSPAAGTAATTSKPVDDAFIKEVAALPAKQQIARFVEEMKKLNPDWDGKVTYTSEKNKVVELSFFTLGVTNITPIRDLSSLNKLTCAGRWNTGGKTVERGTLEDLSPLTGLKLESLDCRFNPIKDLLPLIGLPLRFLKLDCTSVEDLTPLRGLPLEHLSFGSTPIRDLTPLKNLQLSRLYIQQTKIQDLSAIHKMSLSELKCDFVPDRDTDILRSNKTLVKINDVPVKEFWERVVDGDIPQPK
jgi:predicted Ser/Thr protein kinase